MEHQKRPYSLSKRPPTRKNRGVFYVRFRDETGAYKSAVSTGCGNRDDALLWCPRRLALRRSSFKSSSIHAKREPESGRPAYRSSHDHRDELFICVARSFSDLPCYPGRTHRGISNNREFPLTSFLAGR